ncbi:MAG: RidA family protein [Bacteroidetes bacterium]|nr:RidA family protein [Bacteroidota bacterium]MCY4234676.1 RidA family protein [Bacteroidota bacterium]
MEVFTSSPSPLNRSVLSGSEWELRYGYSRAVRRENHIFVSGTTAVTPEGNVVGLGDAFAQTKYILSIIERALIKLESSLSNTVRTRIYVQDIHVNAEAVGRAHSEVFKSICPASTMVGVVALIKPELLVEIELDAVI